MFNPSLNANFFIGNRRQLFKKLAADILIITANGLLQKTADQIYPFRQDSNFWYLTGINEPDLILVKTATEEFIIVPDFYVHRQSVTGPLDKEETSKASGISEILSEKEGWQKVKSLVSLPSKIATVLPPPTLIKFYGLYSNPARRQLSMRLKRLYPGSEFIDARVELARARMAKQPVEIELIQKALDITTETLKTVLAREELGKYKDTAQLEAAILAGFIAHGGSGHAFDPVIAGGPNGALFHFEDLGRPIKNGELLTCDVGSIYSFYNADITRTVAVGESSKRAEDIFRAVGIVQKEAMKLLKPGILSRDYEEQVEKLVGQQLKTLGLIKDLSRKSIRRYYPHSCSHSLGIDVHDSADYSAPLPEGMVMTVEPGIYIKEEGIGVRIEDVVLLEADGIKLMSGSLPVSLTL